MVELRRIAANHHVATDPQSQRWEVLPPLLSKKHWCQQRMWVTMMIMINGGSEKHQYVERGIVSTRVHPTDTWMRAKTKPWGGWRKHAKTSELKGNVWHVHAFHVWDMLQLYVLLLFLFAFDICIACLFRTMSSICFPFKKKCGRERLAIVHLSFRCLCRFCRSGSSSKHSLGASQGCQHEVYHGGVSLQVWHAQREVASVTSQLPRRGSQRFQPLKSPDPFETAPCVGHWNHQFHGPIGDCSGNSKGAQSGMSIRLGNTREVQLALCWCSAPQVSVWDEQHEKWWSHISSFF